MLYLCVHAGIDPDFTLRACNQERIRDSKVFISKLRQHMAQNRTYAAMYVSINVVRWFGAVNMAVVLVLYTAHQFLLPYTVTPLCRCAAPAVVLEHHGLLDGKAATCHPNFAARLKNQSQIEDRVVVSGNVGT